MYYAQKAFLNVGKPSLKINVHVYNIFLKYLIDY